MPEAPDSRRAELTRAYGDTCTNVLRWYHLSRMSDWSYTLWALAGSMRERGRERASIGEIDLYVLMTIAMSRIRRLDPGGIEERPGNEALQDAAFELVEGLGTFTGPAELLQRALAAVFSGLYALANCSFNALSHIPAEPLAEVAATGPFPLPVGSDGGLPEAEELFDWAVENARRALRELRAAR